MDRLKHQKLEEDQPYDGALQQITPAPENFVPQGMIEFDKKDEITIRRKPNTKRLMAAILYFTLQAVMFFGLVINYNIFGGLADLVLWGLSITTFIAYFRVSFSNPGYFEGNVIILEDHEEEINEYDLNTLKDPKPQGNHLIIF